MSVRSSDDENLWYLQIKLKENNKKSNLNILNFNKKNSKKKRNAPEKNF